MPITQIACLGLSHHTTPVALRERISCLLSEEAHRSFAIAAESVEGISELSLLTTCNRIELYARVEADATTARDILRHYLEANHSVDLGPLRDHLYFYTGRAAVEHLARVAAGLDSLVLGEPQILGQVTDAYVQGVESGAIGDVLSVLFRCAIRTGKRARTETAISSNPASISSVSITLAEQIVGNLQEHDVLVIGLGQMGQLALSALRKRKVSQIAVANRTPQRAERLNGDGQTKVYTLEQLPQALVSADVVISATAAPHILIDRQLAEKVAQERQTRPLVIIDIAVPRDVEPEVRHVDGIHLFNMDDLQDTLDRSLAARKKEIPKVEAIIEEELESLDREYREFTIKPVISTLRQKAEVIRQRELQRTMRYLGEDIDPETLKHVQHLSRSLVNKLLHEPTSRLRERATADDAEEYASTVRDLFNLNDSAQDEHDA